MSALEIIIRYREGLMGGLLTSLKLAGAAWVVGLVFGTFLGIMAVRYKRTVGLAGRVLTYFVSSIPVLVLLFWLHYPLQSGLSVVIDPFITATTVLSLLNVVAVAEIVRGGLEVFPGEYVSAAKVCGLRRSVIFFRIQLPLILRQVSPGLLQAQVAILHATLFASLISVNELFRVSQQINSVVYAPVPVYTGLALFFLVVTLPVNLLASRLRRRYGRDLTQR